ncbi:MAG: outer membrane beta-barrel protein [Pseudomonadota bacterium]
MSKLLHSTLLVLPLIAAAGMVHAADAVIEPAPVAPAPVDPPPGFWNGFYIGGLVGYHDESVDETPGSGDGATVGVYVGYNYRLKNDIVLGVEGDYNAAFGDGWTGLGGELTQFGTVRARVGYAMDRWLVYAAGGLAYVKFEPITGFAGPDVDETGWTIGGGADYMVTNNISLRGEYLYMKFDDTFEELGAPSGVSTDVHNARFGAAFHF